MEWERESLEVEKAYLLDRLAELTVELAFLEIENEILKDRSEEQ